MPYFYGHDGVRLAYREVGAGRPLIMLHGFTGDSSLWDRQGIAATIAAVGYRVILPDFRGHGQSAKPHDVSAYPPDVLADDGLALVEHLGLDDYDLGGYSLGGRIVVRMLARGATPGRAVVGGQGMREVLGIGGGAGERLRRIHTGRGSFEPGSPEERAEAWYASRGEDLDALVQVLDSVVATPAEMLGGIRVPTLVLMGSDDERASSAGQLVDVLANGTLTLVPGDHVTAVAAPEFVAAIVDFLPVFTTPNEYKKPNTTTGTSTINAVQAGETE
jgi:pimeloyl-ACP methyl ester carboxylesterase